MYSGCGGPILADQNPNLFASPLLLPPVDNTDEYTVCVVFTCCFSPMRSHWCGEACTLHLPEVSRHYGVVVKFCFWPVRSRFDPRPVQKLEPTPTVLQLIDCKFSKLHFFIKLLLQKLCYPEPEAEAGSRNRSRSRLDRLHNTGCAQLCIVHTL